MGDCTSKKQRGSYYESGYEKYTNELQANSLKKSILQISKLEQPSLFPQQRKQGRKFYEEQIRTTPERTTQKKTERAQLKMSPFNSNNILIQNEMVDQWDQNQEHKPSHIIAKRSNESKKLQQKQEKQHKGAQTKEIASNATNHGKRSGSEDSSQGLSSLSSKQSTVTRRSRAYIAGLEVISEASLQTSIRRDGISKHDKMQSFDPYSLGSNNPFYLHTQVVKTESAYQYGPSNPATFQWQVTI